VSIFVLYINTYFFFYVVCKKVKLTQEFILLESMLCKLFNLPLHVG